MEYTVTIHNEEGHEHLNATIGGMPSEWKPNIGQKLLFEALWSLDTLVKAEGGKTMDEIMEDLVEAYEEGWM